MEELTNYLMKFDYPKNHNRKNILNEGDKSYYGFVLEKPTLLPSICFAH